MRLYNKESHERMISKLHLSLLRETLDLASRSVNDGGLPFAALLCSDSEVLSSSGDRRHIMSDPTAHPEMVVIQDYCRRSGLANLSQSTLYTNVEPCIMCAAAIYWSYIGTVVFSVSQAQLRLLSNGPPRPTAESIANREGMYVTFSGPHLLQEGIQILKMHPTFQRKELHVSGGGEVDGC